MERSGGDKQDVVRPDHPVAAVHGCALDDRQDVALHSLATDVGSVARFPSGDLVQLVQENDAGLFRTLHGRPCHLVHVQQLLFLFLDQIVNGLGHAHLALFGLGAEKAGQDILDVDVHILDAGVADDFKSREAPFAHVDLHRAVVEPAFAELLAEFLAAAREVLAGPLRLAGSGRGVARGRDTHRPPDWTGKQQIQQALFRVGLGLVGYLFEFFLPHHVNGDLHQVADHGFHIPADVAHFGELGGLHLQEGRVGQPGQPPRNLRFAHAGRPDHDDVLGHDLFGHLRRKLLSPDAVAQSDGHGSLGGLLSHHVLVQLHDDLARRHLVESRSLFEAVGKVDHHTSSERNPFIVRRSWFFTDNCSLTTLHLKLFTYNSSIVTLSLV